MVVVVKFPSHCHRRSPAGRAARATRSSAVSPADLARSVDRIADHHSSGIRSLWSHLRAAVTGAPISVASAAGEPHSATTARNESNDVMSAVGVIAESDLGQSVLNSKAILSHDCGQPVRQTPGMGKELSEAEHKRRFIERTKRARESQFRTQNPILTILDVSQGTYKQYESRTQLPHRYIPKFCAACQVSVEWLLTGEGKGPAEQPVAAPEKPVQAKRGRRAA